jgi:hypothetical protein
LRAGPRAQPLLVHPVEQLAGTPGAYGRGHCFCRTNAALGQRLQIGSPGLAVKRGSQATPAASLACRKRSPLSNQHGSAAQAPTQRFPTRPYRSYVGFSGSAVPGRRLVVPSA